MGNLPDHADVVVIGAGIVGSSLVYHLADRGWRNIVLLDGRPVKTAADWTAKRRPETFALIEKEMFGQAPPRPALSFTVGKAAQFFSSE